MAGDCGEITAGALDCVGIAVAFGAPHGEGIGGDQLIEGSEMIVQRCETSLCLGDLATGRRERQLD